jgi:TPR repeat protein
MLLYSLSLRHGWGCAANPAKAVEYLHLAAENASAQVDQNGVVRPTATLSPATPITPDIKSPVNSKGSATLALAIYELGQSYMHGWGVQKDKHLALRCFEMSANFGDTDGQWYCAWGVGSDCSETAWCYLHGIGAKKNATIAARYYRMAEKQGVKSVGLSWIWKEKYDEGGNDGTGRMGSGKGDNGHKAVKKGKKGRGTKNST